jgi:serine/threonine protein kinase
MGCAPSSTSSVDVGREGGPATLAMIEFNARFEDDFERGAKLGVGQQGTVYACVERTTGRLCAMKETHIGAFGASARRREAYVEIELLSRMHHPNVVRVVKAYQTSSEIRAVMEHAGDETLVQFLVRLDAREDLDESAKASVRHELLRQLVDAVAHVHSREVVFRDLKHENVVVASDAEDLRDARITLVDFGRAASLRREERLENQPPLGTSLFQAPEVEQRREYGQAADMWAVGVFAYFLTTGKMPFEHTVAGLYKVLRGEYEPMDKSVGRDARDFVAKLLVLKPAKRINAAQAITHRFLRRGGAASHVGRGDALRVPKGMENVARKQLKTLVMQESLERHTVGLLTEMLTPDDVLTLKRWLAMKSERSIHRGSANYRAQSPSDSPISSADVTIRDGHQYADETKAVHVALNALHAELAKEGGLSPDSSFHGGALTKMESLSKLSAAFEDLAALEIGDSDDENETPSPPSANTLSSKKRSTRSALGDVSKTNSASNLSDAAGSPASSTSKLSAAKREFAPRSFVGFAHASGMCTVDELITACLSCGLSNVADELQKVRDDLKSERIRKLKALGTDAETQKDSVILDIMLFRFDDLLAKVESAHLQQLKDWSVHGATSRDGKAMLKHDVQGATPEGRASGTQQFFQPSIAT